MRFNGGMTKKELMAEADRLREVFHNKDSVTPRIASPKNGQRRGVLLAHELIW